MSENRLDNVVMAKDAGTSVSDNAAVLSNAANSADGAKTLQDARAGAADTAQAHLPTLDISFGTSADTNATSSKGEANTSVYKDGSSAVVQNDGHGDTTTTRYDSQHRVTSVDSKKADGSEQISSYEYDAKTGIKTEEFHSTSDSQNNKQSTYTQYDAQTGKMTDFSALDSRTHTGMHDHYENGQLDYEVLANNKGDATTNYFEPGTGAMDYQESIHGDGSKQQKWIDTDTQQVTAEIDEDKNGDDNIRGAAGGSSGMVSESK